MHILPNVIDIEASGFGKESYPIEVGYILANGDIFCSLIKPVDEWNRWDKTAEQIHGISQEILFDVGRNVEEITQILNKRLSGQTLYSDAWGNDSSWLGLLFDVANCPMRFRLDSIRSLLTEEQAMLWHQTKDQVINSNSLKRHRASSDAAILQKTFSLIQSESRKIV